MEQLLNDQGSNIDRSSVIKEVYNTLQVGKIRTSAYKPSTNGLAENANKQIKICLTKYVLENTDTWPDKIKIIEFAYNNTPQNKATQFSPSLITRTIARTFQKTNDEDDDLRWRQTSSSAPPEGSGSASGDDHLTPP